MKRLVAGYEIEDTLRRQGHLLVAGIDEVGRGSLAGPLVAGVVILPNNCTLELFDSKTLSGKNRTDLALKIQQLALGYGLGRVTNVEIDSNGLAWALHEAYIRAIIDMDMEISHVILDGSVNYLDDYELCETVVKGDSKVACIAAASILAKVARDEYMYSIAGSYPVYGYETNVGYGTVSHREAIKEHGLSDLHRKSFCRNIYKKSPDYIGA